MNNRDVRMVPTISFMVHSRVLPLRDSGEIPTCFVCPQAAAGRCHGESYCTQHLVREKLLKRSKQQRFDGHSVRMEVATENRLHGRLGNIIVTKLLMMGTSRGSVPVLRIVV